MRRRSVAIAALGMVLISTGGRSAELAADQTIGDGLTDKPTATSSKTTTTFSKDPVGYLFAPFQLAERPILKQSVFVFGGETNGRDLWSTAVFNLNRPGRKIYDNSIVGAAYQRDFVHLSGGLFFGGELGLADRFGHYSVCCDTIVYSNVLLQSAELWGGLTFTTLHCLIRSASPPDSFLA